MSFFRKKPTTEDKKISQLAQEVEQTRKDTMDQIAKEIKQVQDKLDDSKTTPDQAKLLGNKLHSLNKELKELENPKPYEPPTPKN